MDGKSYYYTEFNLSALEQTAGTWKSLDTKLNSRQQMTQWWLYNFDTSCASK